MSTTDTTAPVPERALLGPEPAPRGGAPEHEHGWRVSSQHLTSEGTVIYVRCVTCGTRRVDLLTPGGIVPGELSQPSPSKTP